MLRVDEDAVAASGRVEWGRVLTSASHSPPGHWHASPQSGLARPRTRTIMSLRFREETTCKLVALYREHASLWDPTDRRYKNRDARNEAYRAILAKLGVDGMSVADLRQKIKNLRCTYYQELQKIEKSKERGDEYVYTPNVKWFTIMHEIYSHMRLNESRSLKEV